MCMLLKRTIFLVLMTGVSLTLGAHASHSEYDQEAIKLRQAVLDGTLSEEYAVEVWKEDSKTIPAWAQGDSEKVKQYYKAHAEGRLDRMLGYVACRMGVIVHGDVTQNQLEQNLARFDIQKLLVQGPYGDAVLSLEAQQLVYDSLVDMPKVYDMHLHNLGYDEGNYLNPKSAALGIATWMDYFTFMVLRYAAGMTSPEGSTQEARRRLQLYAAHFPKLEGIVLPIHQAFTPDGEVDWKNTGSYLANQAALKTALTFSSDDSELFPAVSVHPFDPKWQEKLISARQKGICLVKWMPPQSIPPDSEAIDRFYILMRELGMVLIAHAGPEHTIPTDKENEQWVDWGNPLRFRKALQMGVNVILAHCGHSDNIPDLDSPERTLIPGYELFLRLAREAREKNKTGEWTGKLYGDLAAVTTHYGPDFIRHLLNCSGESCVRLIYGSDYPFTNLIKPRKDAYEICAQEGLLDQEKVEPLKEIRNWNPLLANYVFTKNLAYVDETGKTFAFPLQTFTGEFSDGELVLIDRELWNQYQNKEDEK
ncbi:MAG: amidohydrolase family protein [Parachlamydiaceae bacterium]|nr:amidohydrolase family protein [Parachlamydiaceae bacterium]